VSRGRRVPSGARRPSLCGRAAGHGWRGRRGPSLGWADMLRRACGAFRPRGRGSARFALGDTARGGRPAACRRARVSCGREARGGPASCLPGPSLGWAGMLRPACGAFCPRGRASARFALGDTARGDRRPAACRRARVSCGREARGVLAPCLPGPSLGWAGMLRPACGAFCPRGRASARFALGDTARGDRCPADCRRARISCGREARGGPAPCLPSAEPRLGGHVAVCVRRVLSAWPSLGAVRAGRHRSRWPPRGLSLSANLAQRSAVGPPPAATAPAAPPCSPARRAAPARGPSPPRRHRPRSASGGWRPRGARPRRRTGAPW